MRNHINRPVARAMCLSAILALVLPGMTGCMTRTFLLQEKTEDKSTAEEHWEAAEGDSTKTPEPMTMTELGESVLELHEDLAEDLAFWDYPQAPDRIETVWSTWASVARPGKPPMRALGAKLMFFTADSEHPVKVDGQVRFFVFEEDADVKSDKPILYAECSAEDVRSAHKKLKAGHVYSFYIPFDELGNPEKTLSVRARFDSADPNVSQIVLSDPRTVLVPGPLDENAEERDALVLAGSVPRADGRGYPGRNVSYEELQAIAQQVSHGAGNERSGMQTETISLTPNFSKHLQAAPPQRSLLERMKAARMQNQGAATVAPLGAGAVNAPAGAFAASDPRQSHSQSYGSPVPLERSTPLAFDRPPRIRSRESSALLRSPTRFQGREPISDGLASYEANGWPTDEFGRPYPPVD